MIEQSDEFCSLVKAYRNATFLSFDVMDWPTLLICYHLTSVDGMCMCVCLCLCMILHMCVCIYKHICMQFYAWECGCVSFCFKYLCEGVCVCSSLEEGGRGICRFGISY